jgi:hypothetical protein
MSRKNQFAFNIKNLKYAFKTLGVFGTPTAMTYARSLSLEADYDETPLYGDGQKLAVLADDKGKTGTLSLINIDEDYEIACGRQMLISKGIADISQNQTVEHALYFEFDLLDEGVSKTVKVWLFGVISGKPSVNLEQTTDNPTINPIEHALTVLGTNLKNAAGTADYEDTNGNTVKVYMLTSYPDDTDYATFGATVPTPSALA